MDKQEPKHKYAEKKIREAISGRKADDKIPGERVFAKELGISYMTVRKAVDSLVAEGVLYKIPKKGTYVADPNKAKSKANRIGYFLDASIKDGVSSPYYSIVFDALEKEASKTGYNLIFFSDISESRSLETMKEIDGVIVSCFPRIEHTVQELKNRMPVVCIDNSSADKSVPSIVIDNFNAVVDAVNYLCNLGHEQIGFITGLEDSDIGRNRLAGYLSALKSNGISEDMDLVFKGDYSFNTGLAGADYFLSKDKQPTAIMCANDMMAIGAIKETSKRRLSVPDDISIIGFDDIFVASQMTPALTTVSAPIAEIAQRSIKMLISMINGNNMDNWHVVLPGQLVIRETCAPTRKHYDRYQGTGAAL